LGVHPGVFRVQKNMKAAAGGGFHPAPASPIVRFDIPRFQRPMKHFCNSIAACCAAAVALAFVSLGTLPAQAEVQEKPGPPAPTAENRFRGNATLTIATDKRVYRPGDRMVLRMVSLTPAIGF
jgi:hypothetical protein